jgi:hypothetical protein
VQNLKQLVEKAQENTKELTAPVLLPRAEDMQVQLVASHSLDRLEEYRADESSYHLLIGIFGGAIFGILSNWFTNEKLTMTRFSIVFIVFLGILTAGSICKLIGIRRRVEKLRARMLRANFPPAIPPIGRCTRSTRNRISGEGWLDSGAEIHLDEGDV